MLINKQIYIYELADYIHHAVSPSRSASNTPLQLKHCQIKNKYLRSSQFKVLNLYPHDPLVSIFCVALLVSTYSFLRMCTRKAYSSEKLFRPDSQKMEYSTAIGKKDVQIIGRHCTFKMFTYFDLIYHSVLIHISLNT